MELKRIDFKAGSFTANGKVYTIEEGISIERYAELQLLEKEMAYGFTVKGIFDKLQTVHANMNKLRFVESAIILNDLMRGAAKLEERTPTILKICTLFMNTPGEDRTTISTDLMDEKITDWKKEGIDIRDFFTVAFSTVNEFLAIYQSVTRTISAMEGNAEGASQ